jgi:cardiolipin synthase
LKTILLWSLSLALLLLTAQFLAGLETSPIVWGDDGPSLSRELWRHIYALRNMFERYVYWILGGHALIAALVIFLEEQNPDRAIIWLGTLLLFPIVGLVAYVIVGPDVRGASHRWRVRRSRRRSGAPRSAAPPESAASPGLERLLEVSCGASPTTRNDVEILLNGEQTFRAIEKALYNATDYIHMEYFSIASDELGTKIKDLLIERARFGVKVRVLYDAVGSWNIGRDFLQELRGAGVEIHPFMPTTFVRFRSSVNHRDHRKIVVVDGRVGFVGGLNIGDMYMGKDPRMGNWRDTHIQISGEAVRELNRAFLSHWGQCTAKYMDYHRFSYAPAAEMEDTPLLIATSGPGNDFRAIADGYFHMIASARKRIWITTPYLVPGGVISAALSVAAKSGVDVRILIPSKPDHTLVFWASQFNVDQLLRSGVRIFSYQDGFIHAKTAVMDGAVVSVGTANLDLRSLEVNYEVQAFIRSEDVAEKFERAFLDDLKKCEEETLAKRYSRPFYRKLQGAIGRLWSSLL